MPYQFESGRIYRMPTHFGPAPAPRQIPAEANADSTRSPRKMLISASFLTETFARSVFRPALIPGLTVESRMAAKGGRNFPSRRMMDLPTMYHVVNALTDLPVLASRGASTATTRGGKSYLNQQILK